MQQVVSSPGAQMLVTRASSYSRFAMIFIRCAQLKLLSDAHLFMDLFALPPSGPKIQKTLARF